MLFPLSCSLLPKVALRIVCIRPKAKRGANSLVISNEVGGFMDPNIFSRWFRGFCVENAFGHYGYVEEFKDSAGRKRERKKKYVGLNFHELRHTQATLLIGSGAGIKTV